MRVRVYAVEPDVYSPTTAQLWMGVAMLVRSVSAAIRARLSAVSKGNVLEPGPLRVQRLVEQLEPVAQQVPGLREYLHFVYVSRFAQAGGTRHVGGVSQTALETARQRLSRWILAMKASAQCESIRDYIRSTERDIASTDISLTNLRWQLEAANSNLHEAVQAADEAAIASAKSFVLGRTREATARAASYAARVTQARADVASLERKLEELEKCRLMLQQALDELLLAYVSCMKMHDRLQS